MLVELLLTEWLPLEREESMNVVESCPASAHLVSQCTNSTAPFLLIAGLLVVCFVALVIASRQ